MPRLTRRLLRDFMRARAVQRWERLAREVDRMPLSSLRGLDDEARTLRRSLNRIVARSNARLDIQRPGAEPLDLPAGTTGKTVSFRVAPLEPNGLVPRLAWRPSKRARLRPASSRGGSARRSNPIPSLLQPRQPLQRHTRRKPSQR